MEAISYYIQNKQLEMGNLQLRLQELEQELEAHKRVDDIIINLQDLVDTSSASLLNEIRVRVGSACVGLGLATATIEKPTTSSESLVEVEAVTELALPTLDHAIAEVVNPVSDIIVNIPLIANTPNELETAPEQDTIVLVGLERILDSETSSSQSVEQLSTTTAATIEPEHSVVATTSVEPEQGTVKRKRRTKLEIATDKYLAMLSNVKDLAGLTASLEEIQGFFANLNQQVPVTIQIKLNDLHFDLNMHEVAKDIEPEIATQNAIALEPVVNTEPTQVVTVNIEPEIQEVVIEQSQEEISIEFFLRLSQDLSESGLADLSDEIQLYYATAKVQVPESLSLRINELWTEINGDSEPNAVIEQETIPIATVSDPFEAWLVQADNAKSKEDVAAVWAAIKESGITPSMLLVYKLEEVDKQFGRSIPITSEPSVEPVESAIADQETLESDHLLNLNYRVKLAQAQSQAEVKRLEALLSTEEGIDAETWECLKAAESRLSAEDSKPAKKGWGKNKVEKSIAVVANDDNALTASDPQEPVTVVDQDSQVTVLPELPAVQAVSEQEALDSISPQVPTIQPIVQQPKAKKGWGKGKIEKSVAVIASDLSLTSDEEHSADTLLANKDRIAARKLPVTFACGTAVARHSEQYILQPGVWVTHHSGMTMQVVEWELASSKNAMVKYDCDKVPLFIVDPSMPGGNYTSSLPHNLNIITEDQAKAIQDQHMQDMIDLNNSERPFPVNAAGF